jgi:hypothetical protein
MPRPLLRTLGPLASCLLFACTADSDPASLDGWMGDEPHFLVQGVLDGEEIDISIDGDADGERVWCEREYEVPLVDGAPDLASAKHIETTIAGSVMIDGEERAFEFELLSHALQDDEPGTELTIVPRVDGADPAADELWLEWEWATVDGDTLYEAAAQDGMLVREQFSGSPGEGGVIIPAGTGFVGGYAEARWSVNEHLKISFSVRCTENEVEEY